MCFGIKQGVKDNLENLVLVGGGVAIISLVEYSERNMFKGSQLFYAY